MTRVVLAVLVSLAFPATALAANDAPRGPDADRAASEPERAKAFSLSLDPTKVPLMGFVSVTGEARLGARRVFPGMRPMDVGAGGFIGAGQTRTSGSDLVPVWSSCDAGRTCKSDTAMWAAAQVVIYPVGSFTHGMQIGAEAGWLQLWRTRDSADLPATHASSGTFMTGAVLGYKYVAPVGLTFNPQVAAGPAITTNGAILLYPRLALNVGWTF